jgi:hypothetical protein
MQAAHERGSGWAALFFPQYESPFAFLAIRQKTVDSARLSAGQDANRTQEPTKKARGLPDA